VEEQTARVSRLTVAEIKEICTILHVERSGDKVGTRGAVRCLFCTMFTPHGGRCPKAARSSRTRSSRACCSSWKSPRHPPPPHRYGRGRVRLRSTPPAASHRKSPLSPHAHASARQSAPVRRRKSKKGTAKSPRAAKSAAGKAKSPGSASKRKSSAAKAKASPKKRATSENIEDDDSDDDDDDDDNDEESDEESGSGDDGSDDYHDTPARKAKAPAAKAPPAAKASPAKKPATPATVDDEDDVPLSALASKGKAPTDEQLKGQIVKIISSSDLGTITNRSVREQLEKHFGVDLTERFAAIKEMITEVLTKS